MPYMTNGKRDYVKENKLYNSKPKNIKARSERTTLRRQANATGITHKGDGLDLDHKIPLSKGGSNTMGNTRVVSQKENRSFSRNADSSLKSQTSKKERKKR
jgi:5-methylcytosine-specific restriction endonuclease McrA